MTRGSSLAILALGAMVAFVPVAHAQTAVPDADGRRAAVSQAGQRKAFIYREYRVDVSQVSTTDMPAVASYAMDQIDIVEAVDVRPDIRRFFRSVPINVAHSQDPFGHYGPEGLKLTPKTETSDRPALLHELLHAYHHRMMPQGFQNADIVMFYDRAVSRHIYKDGAYLTKNVQEFFAVTTSLYLWGKIKRPPFTRERLKQAQPVYYDYLAKLFGHAS